jgi:hypothetical protein
VVMKIDLVGEKRSRSGDGTQRICRLFRRWPSCFPVKVYCRKLRDYLPFLFEVGISIMDYWLYFCQRHATICTRRVHPIKQQNLTIFLFKPLSKQNLKCHNSSGIS